MNSMHELLGPNSKGADNSYQQMVFLLCGSRVKRFHVRAMIHETTDAHHQHGVAWFVWLITNGGARAQFLMAALSHDMAEQCWGDIPATAKWAIDAEQFTKLEEETLAENGMQFALSIAEEVILKVADHLEIMLNCIHERRLGNRNVEAVFKRVETKLQETEQAQKDSFIYARVQHLVAALRQLWLEALLPDPDEQGRVIRLIQASKELP